MIAGNVKHWERKTPTQVKAIESDGGTSLEQMVMEGFSEEVTVQQRQRNEGCNGKSQLCKSPTEEHSGSKKSKCKGPVVGMSSAWGRMRDECGWSRVGEGESGVRGDA